MARRVTIKNKRKHSNQAYRILYHIMFTPSDHCEFVDVGEYRLKTRPWSIEMGLTSFQILKALRYLVEKHIVNKIETEYGKVTVYL